MHARRREPAGRVDRRECGRELDVVRLRRVEQRVRAEALVVVLAQQDPCGASELRIEPPLVLAHVGGGGAPERRRDVSGEAQALIAVGERARMLVAHRGQHSIDVEAAVGQIHVLRGAHLEAALAKRRRDVRIGRREALSGGAHLVAPAEMDHPVSQVQADASEGARDARPVFGTGEVAAGVLTRPDGNDGRSGHRLSQPACRSLAAGTRNAGRRRRGRRVSPPAAGRA
jgi:hypothetical protein